MRIHVCGVRGSTPAPGAAFIRYGGHTSCLALAHDGEPPTLLLDAGTGIRRVPELLDGEPFRGTILLGHLHWDHTQGLPFFTAGDRPDARVEVLMPEQGDALAVLARMIAPPFFPVDPTGLRGDWRFAGLAPGVHVIEGFTVLALEIPHKGGRTFGYRVSDGSGSLAYLSDHGPVALGDGPDGFGPYHPDAVALADGVDVLFHDAQYTAAEWAARAGFGHSAVDYAVGLAQRAAARRLMLFHHDPARTDHEINELVAALADEGAPLPVEAAAEGTVLTLGAAVQR
ncbi:MAG: MBL fold metallo-hydrolase [Actinomycetota bacterium]